MSTLLLTKLINRVERDDKGATAVEYGLMVALVAVAIIAAVTFMQGKLSGLFSQIGNAL